MLAAYAQAFLAIGNAQILAGFVAQKELLELVHARVGEHKGRVILHHNRGGRNYTVFFRLKKLDKGFPDLGRGQLLRHGNGIWL